MCVCVNVCVCVFVCVHSLKHLKNTPPGLPPYRGGGVCVSQTVLGAQLSGACLVPGLGSAKQVLGEGPHKA